MSNENLTQNSWLRSTLDAYEVEEVEGHDLVRILPQILHDGGAVENLGQDVLDDE